MAPHQRLTSCKSFLPERNPYPKTRIPITEKNKPITNRRSNSLFMISELKENNIKYQSDEQNNQAKPKRIFIPYFTFIFLSWSETINQPNQLIILLWCSKQTNQNSNDKTY